MTFATLLNGYALNSTIRLTFSEPEQIVGEALATGAEPTRIVFATGSAQSQADSTGVSTRTAHMNPMVCGGEAVAPAVDAWRVMKVEALGISSGASSTGSFTRLAYAQPQTMVSSAEAKTFEPVRLARLITTPQVKDQTLNGFMLGESAWHDGRSDSFANSTVESQTLATRLVTPATVSIAGTAQVSPLAYDLTRWMQPKQARNRAISYVKEGLIFTLKVNQQYATGTAIARSHSRGTPNTILAFSITYAEAGMSLAQSAVKIARDAVLGRIIVQAKASGVTQQDHAIRGTAIATATGHISPSVIYAARYVHVRERLEISAVATGQAAQFHVVTGTATATAHLQTAPVITRVAGEREVYLGGVAQAVATSQAAAGQTHYASGEAQAFADSGIRFTVIRTLGSLRHAYVWGKTAGFASLSVATAVRWPMVRGVRQPASADLNVTQLIDRDMHGKALAYGASLSDPVESRVTHNVWMNGQAQAKAQTSIQYTALRKTDGIAKASSSTTGIPCHWVAVPADGVAQAKAEAYGANPRIYTDGAGTGKATAHLSITGFKVAYVSGIANAGGATLGEAAKVTRHMRPSRIEAKAVAKRFYPTQTHVSHPAQIEGVADISMVARNARVAATPIKSECGSQIDLAWAETLGAVGARHYRSIYAPAEFTAASVVTLPWAEQFGEVGARRLSWIVLTDVGAAYAQAGLGRNVFKINAGDPAPDWRVLDVPFVDRSQLIATSSREYTV